MIAPEAIVIMDHRWDDRIRQERDARSERERYGARPIEPDESVERRDRIARARPPMNFSPWAIGEAHWNQRDLYTRDARTDDAGYARGPAVHPEVGSYAYTREEAPPPSRRGGDAEGPSLYEREAWPWLNYHDDEARHGRPPLWSRMKETFARAAGRPSPRRGPKNWRLSDERVREEVCETLAHHGALDASDIDVTVESAEVTLRGTVPDRRSKRLAEHIVEDCRGVEDVHNRLEVRRPDDTDANVAFVMPARAFG